MADSGVSPGSSGGGLKQSNIGLKKISELTTNVKYEHELNNNVHIAKAKLVLVQRKSQMLEPSSLLVARQYIDARVARKRANAIQLASRYLGHGRKQPRHHTPWQTPESV